jgi:putative membrane protein
MVKIWVALVAVPLAAYGKTMSDGDFVRKAASVGGYQVRAARLALSKSQDDQVKSIAQHLIDDHQAANDKLQRIAADEGMALSPQLEPEQQQLLDKLQGLSGKDFDQAYLAQQKGAHQQAIDLFQNEAATGQDPALKSFAQQTLPALRQHYQMLSRTKPM